MNGSQGTITRSAVSAVDELSTAFRSLYGTGYVNKNDALLCIDKLREAGGRSNRPSILRRLFDILDACGVSYERGRDDGYYESLVMSAPMPSFGEIEDKMLAAMYELYLKYPTPETYLKRIVDAHDNGGGGASLRLRILRRAVECGSFSYTTETVCDGEVKEKKVTMYGGELYLRKYLEKKLKKKPKKASEHVSLIDDDAFDVLTETSTSSEQKKPGGPYGMLQMINDLSSGQLKACGATKKALYLFAMFYDMTFATSSGIANPKTDVEDRLFSNYYTYDLLRFVSESGGAKSEYENNPMGEGINYKNYAEMTYLYFIAKSGLTAAEKIKRSDELISRLPGLQSARCAEGGESRPSPHSTKFYRDAVKHTDGDLFAEDILELGEKEFTEFLLENYDCSRATKYSSAMQTASEQRTAYREYRSLLAGLLDILRSGKDDGVSADTDSEREISEEDMKELKRSFGYGLWFADPYGAKSDETKKRLCESLKKRRGGADPDEKSVESYITLLAKANDFLTDAFSVTSPSNVTRASVIAAYYYYYNARHENDGERSPRSFADVFGEYREGLDPILRACFMRELGAKNLLDVLVVFSSYAYLNL